ncbi:SDR family NAD(P)-dependent oxidoreductase [Nocardia sp. NPDC003979]
MTATLADRVILITGGCGGIGAATATQLAAAGARVIVTDIEEEAVARVAAEIGPHATGMMLDVTDPARCQEVVEAVIATHGRLDVVWSNAGVSSFGPLDLVEYAEWARVIDINLTGARNIVAAALPAVVAVGGYVGLTCSWASFAHQPGHTAYASSKAGLEAMGNALRIELAGTGARVGTFHPGWIDTALVSTKIAQQSAVRALLDALPGPFGSVVPLEGLVPAIVHAIERRSTRLVYPRAGRLLVVLRPLLPTRLFTMRSRSVAPIIRQKFQQDQMTGEKTQQLYRIRERLTSDTTRRSP